MVKRELEGIILRKKEDAVAYEEYLESYVYAFDFISNKCLYTPINQVYSMGYSAINNKKDYTILEAFSNYIAKGRLYEIMTQFWNYKETSTRKSEYLIKLLKEKGYNIDTLKKDLVKKFISSVMERVNYILTEQYLNLVISDKYNLEVVIDEKR
jgi:hypothetical protein